VSFIIKELSHNFISEQSICNAEVRIISGSELTRQNYQNNLNRWHVKEEMPLKTVTLNIIEPQHFWHL
jgi:hypothetical protein